jgi:uncharacterized membrane protein
MNNLTIKETFLEGWKYTKEHIGFLIGYLLIMIIVSILFRLVGDAFHEKNKLLIAFVVNVIGAIVGLYMHMGFYNSALMITSWMKPTFEQLYSNGRHFVSFFAANILFDLMVSVGLILLIVPGFYLLAKFGLFPFFILDQNLGPIEALKAASKASEGKRWFLFLFFISALLINIVGALLLVVGLLFTIPLTLLAFAVVYRKITSEQQEIKE